MTRDGAHGPLVTAVIPAYNAERWIEGSVKSVLTQTYSPIELIVVDDGSTDRTLEILRGFGSALRCLSQRNRGVSEARNAGASTGTGDFVAFLDADDEWLPEKTAVQVSRLEASPERVASFMSLIKLDVSTGARTNLRYRPSPRLTEDLLLHSCVVGAPSSFMVRRGVFVRSGGFDPAFSQCADWDMWLRLSQLGPVDVVEEPHVVYRVHDRNMSRDASLLERDSLAVLRKFFSIQADGRFSPLERDALANHYLIAAGSYLHAGKPLDCLRCLFNVAVRRPKKLGRALGAPWRFIRRKFEGDE